MVKWTQCYIGLQLIHSPLTFKPCVWSRLVCRLNGTALSLGRNALMVSWVCDGSQIHSWKSYIVGGISTTSTTNGGRTSYPHRRARHTLWNSGSQRSLNPALVYNSGA